MIKQALQFLNAFRFGSENKIMFFTRQPDEIDRAIIGFNSIKMMNMPTTRQRFAITLLPYQKMFCNISQFSCSRMLRIPNQYVTIPINNFSTFPVITPTIRRLEYTTMDTGFRSPVHWFATNRTRYFTLPNVFCSSFSLFSKSPFCSVLRQIFVSFFRGTRSASLSMSRYLCPTINTIMGMVLLPLHLIFRPTSNHIYHLCCIIPHFRKQCSKVILDSIEEVTKINDKDYRWHDGKRVIGVEEPYLLITIGEGDGTTGRD